MSLDAILKEASSNFPQQPQITRTTPNGVTYAALVLALNDPASKVYIDIYFHYKIVFRNSP